MECFFGFWFVKDPNGYSCVQSDQNDRRLNETVFDLIHSRILNPKNLTIELGQAHDSYHAEFIFDNDGTDVSPFCLLTGTLGLVSYHMIRSEKGSILNGQYDMGHVIWALPYGPYHMAITDMKNLERIWWLWNHSRSRQIERKSIWMWLFRIFRRWTWFNIPSSNKR